MLSIARGLTIFCLFVSISVFAQADKNLDRVRLKSLSKMHTIGELVEWIQNNDPTTLPIFHGEQQAYLGQHFETAEIGPNSLRVRLETLPAFVLTFDGKAISVDRKFNFAIHDPAEAVFAGLKKYFSGVKSASLSDILLPSVEAAVPDPRSTLVVGIWRELFAEAKASDGSRMERAAISGALDELRPHNGKGSQLYAFKCSGEKLEEAVFQQQKNNGFLGDATGAIRLKVVDSDSKPKLQIFRCDPSLKGDQLRREDVLEKSCGELIYEVQGRGFTGDLDTEMGRFKGIPQYKISAGKRCSRTPQGQYNCEDTKFSVGGGQATNLITVDPTVGGLAWCCSSLSCAKEATRIALPQITNTESSKSEAVHD